MASRTLVKLFQDREIPRTFICNNCHATIVGHHHHCTICNDYDLCDSCRDDVTAFGDNHKVEHAMVIVESDEAATSSHSLPLATLRCVGRPLIAMLIENHSHINSMGIGAAVSYFRLLHILLIHLSHTDIQQCKDLLTNFVDLYLVSSPPRSYHMPIDQFLGAHNSSAPPSSPLHEYILMLLLFGFLLRDKEKRSSKSSSTSHEGVTSSGHKSGWLAKEARVHLVEKLLSTGLMAHARDRLKEIVLAVEREKLVLSDETPSHSGECSHRFIQNLDILNFASGRCLPPSSTSSDDSDLIDLTPFFKGSSFQPLLGQSAFCTLSDTLLHISYHLLPRTHHSKSDKGSTSMDVDTSPPLPPSTSTVDDIGEWRSLARLFIHHCSAASAKRAAKKLLLALCQSRAVYLYERDIQTFQTLVGSFQNNVKELSEGGSVPASYMRLPHATVTAAYGVLSQLESLTSARPQNWQVGYKSYHFLLKFFI